MERGISTLYVALLGMLLIGGISCSDDYLEPVPIKTGEGLRLNLGSSTMRAADVDAVLSEMHLYSFSQNDAGGSGFSGSPTSHFHHRVAGVTYAEGSMTLTSSQMRVGLWDLAMVAHRGATLTPALAAKQAGELLMYTFDSAINGGEAHQFYHRFHRLPEITVDNDHRILSSVSRNVAKVKIIVDRAVDVSTHQDAVHTIQLNKVPSRISWAGTLLKTISGGYETTPSDFDVLPNGALTRNIAFSPTAESGIYESNELEFIIPAHRGKDFWNADGVTQNLLSVDTITRKLEIAVSFTKESGGTFTKTVTIPVVSRCNSILVAHLKMQDTNLEIKTEVEEWTSKDVGGDVGAPYLNVSETETTLYGAAPSRIHFWSNQPADSVFVTRAGKIGDTPILDIDTELAELSGASAVNRHYDADTQSGYIDIINLAPVATQADVKIYLKASSLRREITVKRVASARTLETPYVSLKRSE